MKVESWEPMASRPCRVCLSLNDGAVFADFDVDDDRLYLVRISFDGFGCCHAPSNVSRMSSQDTAALLDLSSGRPADPSHVARVVRDYLASNESLLWSDALRSHDLV